MNIAYLEDDLIQQEVLKGIARDLGHQISCYQTLPELMQGLSENSFQLIFLDNLLENDVDAFESLGGIREKVGPTVGIIGLTGASAFSELKIAYENLFLMNHVLFKPVTSDDLESAIYFIGGQE